MIPVRFFKKALIALMLCISCITALHSQVYSNKESSILFFSAGITSSNLLKDSMHFKPGILFHGGIGYSVVLNDRFNVAAEVQYTGKGFKNESPIIKYRYFFVDVPLYAQVKFGESIRINAGVQYSVATNSQVVVIDPSKANGVNIINSAAAKPSDYSFLLGAEVDITKSFSLAARYSVSGSTFFVKNDINFGVFQFSVKYAAIKTYQVFFHKKDLKQ
jgi:hypothetical protein